MLINKYFPGSKRNSAPAGLSPFWLRHRRMMIKMIPTMKMWITFLNLLFLLPPVDTSLHSLLGFCFGSSPPSVLQDIYHHCDVARCNQHNHSSPCFSFAGNHGAVGVSAFGPPTSALGCGIAHRHGFSLGWHAA